jgi:hypothetical protein
MAQRAIDVQHRPPRVARDGFRVRLDGGTELAALVKFISARFQRLGVHRTGRARAPRRANLVARRALRAPTARAASSRVAFDFFARAFAFKESLVLESRSVV